MKNSEIIEGLVRVKIFLDDRNIIGAKSKIEDMIEKLCLQSKKTAVKQHSPHCAIDLDPDI